MGIHWDTSHSGTLRPRGLRVIFLHRFRVWKIFLCVCVSGFILVRGRNFYPFDTKFGTQEGLVKSKVQFKNELCRSHRGITERNSSITCLFLDLRVSLDTFYQD